MRKKNNIKIDDNQKKFLLETLLYKTTLNMNNYYTKENNCKLYFMQLAVKKKDE